jgi:hypothetical protein
MRNCPSEGIRSVVKKHFSNLECLSARIAMKAKQAHQGELPRFETDARAIRIDNCASYCISNDMKEFITNLKKSTRNSRGRVAHLLTFT